MASRLRRDPRRGRVWYPPARVEISRAVGRAELVDRLYREGGPKHGLRQRKDAIETLWRGYTYLRLRAQREGSGDFATTAEQTVVGLTFELSRRGAKAWDSTLAQGLEGNERREVLLRSRGSALSKLLDELARAGLLVWGGERDNHGLWWRLRIRLLEPEDEQPPDWEPWMRSIDPPVVAPAVRGRAPGARDDDVRERSLAKVDLGRLYGRVEALTGHRPRLEARQVVQLRRAVQRFVANAAARPPGTPGEPLEVLLAQIEHFAPHDHGALAWALARFDGYTRQLQARARVGAPPVQSPAAGAGAAPASANCAALLNRQLNPDVSELSALACRTGAHGPVDEVHDAGVGTAAGQGPGTVKQRTEGEQGLADPVDFGALLERVAARELHLEALAPQLRGRAAQTVARARSWPAEGPVPLGLVTEAAQALAGGAFVAPRPWLTDRQADRLRRAERRYTRYAGQRPEGSPPAPAAVLVDLVEYAPADIRHPLPWGIAQLDLLTKRMRREHHRTLPARRARQRAESRRQLAAEQAGAFYRCAPASAIEAVVEHQAESYLGRRPPEKAAGWAALEDQLRAAGHLPTDAQLTAAKERSSTGFDHSRVENRGWRWRQLNSQQPHVDELAQIPDALHAIGVGVTGEQLRRKIRDRLLLAGCDPAALEQLKRPEPGVSYTPESYASAAAQLTGAELHRSRELAIGRPDRPRLPRDGTNQPADAGARAAARRAL